MKIVHIKQKLVDIGIELENLSLGDFDRVGCLTAQKVRDPSEPLYRTAGALFRPNYERGIMIYSLIRAYGCKSLLEIGTGRGYVSFCAAKAFYDMGITGRIVTIDPASNEQFFRQLVGPFPQDWFNMIEFRKETSDAYFARHLNERFDLIYVDGAHDAISTANDVRNSNEVCNVAMLCDDYHLPSKDDPGIQCRQALDAFDWQANGYNEPEMIRGDRRIFFDDRRLPDEAIDYGQLLAVRSSYQLCLQKEDSW